MFSKILKKSLRKTQVPAEVIFEPESNMNAGVAWENRLKAALGNDTELLALAVEAPSVDQKLACIRALASEEGLKAAEREFRKRDRRVHSAAKQRYEALVKQRETRAGAAELIAAAEALVDAPVIPANRLVELNQAWERLDPALFEDHDKSYFARLQAGLAELMRERVERKRTASRWSDAASKALEELNLARAGVAATAMGLQDLAAMLAAASERARAALAEMPPTDSSAISDDGVAALGTAIRSALQESALIETRLAILAELQAWQAPQQKALNDGDSSSRAAVKAAAIERWKGLEPLEDHLIEKALNARYEGCLRVQDEARRKPKKQGSPAASEEAMAKQANTQALTAAADAAEAALAAGHLAEAATQLTMLQKSSGNGVNAALQARIGALQAEFSRLKGWQHWGGGRVRDDLVAEAEALAASTVAREGAPPVKLAVKQIENGIEHLRARWKELDRLGGATSKPLWQRFDAALKTAQVPVAAHQAKLKEARQENLTARKNLLDALDALNVIADDQNSPDWKEINRALSRFQTEWRKLGPVEHTVPHKSQSALLERMKASIARLEQPLREVQAGAQAEREQLIVRAKALSQDAHSRDMMAKLRELQAQWQAHAKSQPLPRKIENKLWAEFRAAADALVSQREAASKARDTELKANQAAREALIARLDELNQDTPPAEIKRVLANVEAEWRNAGEAPRNQATGLESRYRAARERSREHIAGSAQRAWQHTCDTLLAKVRLCEELESGAPSTAIEARWNALPTLPARWEQPLQARCGSGGVPAKSGEALDRLLLQLESSLEIPSPPAFHAARQTLKLIAMKNAMEGRGPAALAWPDIEKMTAEAIGYTHLSPDQLGRLQSVIAALRRYGPGRPQKD